MSDVDVEVRKWGDSLAVIIPRRVVAAENLRVNERIWLHLEKKIDISDVFGIAKGKISMTPQELKNAAKKGWD